MTIKAINTKYAGCNFRSRLEARWAIFFDTLNIKWEYEKEGYDLDGLAYLPDFWLPKEKIFIEIKGNKNIEGIDFEKTTRLSSTSKFPVIILAGNIGYKTKNNEHVPNFETYYIDSTLDEMFGNEIYVQKTIINNTYCVHIPAENITAWGVTIRAEDNGFLSLGDILIAETMTALDKATEARFEHNKE